ncbi:MAG: cysteine--tRNA ligase [Candidatus Brennerbacteria bacterium RIFOXYC1_FULL_41_11]|uniref:Cysteine--tRNA ligase n=1 Tax=Candidatus Brennerbacteria bacterium RIFOXYD1_FULL_41_16 TaxID=1797529 RepID=A0A1G1XJW0_9BACT|nr:MAG: cysteine--tRNA ligase [Candidatus Brennerbacteria bacterium RIFOXYB1_FULL_41_13]OGY39079.1 MAG: cysteine--tRNA ligase [Candidatus Brennerbacteria bacterium RIFOXYC1_FULL_41_11]OGY40232.1 MAG: cysteine--tRNA ligase [Candidatus Brennerbacteria bacterium RIFOXYD1_FULL_41_16]
MKLKIYNTLSRKLEEFIPIEANKLRFYHCGPTVYWAQHIGNLRGMTMGDLVVRTFKYLNYETLHVRNYTDVGHLTGDNIGDADSGEDRMEKSARAQKLSPDIIAQKYIDQFEEDTKAINLLEPTHKPRATEYIPQMVEMTQTLIEKGFAYETDLAVYFDVKKFPDYTKLSGQNLEKMQKDAGKGDVSDAQKKSPLDFALWFFKAGVHKNSLQSWPSPFKSKLVKKGRGFPGWHIECSVMSKTLLGDALDAHMGGVEHIPIHHTNEIAQSESANNKKFVNYWLHNEHLLVNDKKMAKSEGTGYSLQEIMEHGFDPLTLRYFFLTAHYRSKQNFTWEALKNAQASLEEMKNKIATLMLFTKEQQAERSEAALALKQKFENALADDFSIPQALATAWETLKSEAMPQEKLQLLFEFDKVLGLKLNETNARQTLSDTPENIKSLIAKREQARKNKDFKKSDDLRKQVENLGFELQDTPDGIRIYKK